MTTFNLKAIGGQLSLAPIGAATTFGLQRNGSANDPINLVARQRAPFNQVIDQRR